MFFDIHDDRTLHDVFGSQHFRTVDVLHEFFYIARCRIGQNFLRRTDLDQFPILQQRDSVPDTQSFVQIMGDEDDGLADICLQIQQFILHLTTDQWIQSREGLVHQ